MADQVDANRLLYDPATLDRYVDEHETPLGVKEALDTSATQYEIRTAMRYWFDGSASHRTSDRVWATCDAIDNGEWELTENNEVVDA